MSVALVVIIVVIGVLFTIGVTAAAAGAWCFAWDG